MKDNSKKIIYKVITVIIAAGIIISAAWFPDASWAKTKKSEPIFTVNVSNIQSGTVLDKSKKYKLKATVTRTKNKKTKKVKNAKITYTSSNKKIATVSKKGVIKTKKKSGVVTITLTYYPDADDEDSAVTKKLILRVGKRVKSISISGKQYYKAGRTSTLTATVTPAKATITKLRWSSSDTSVVKVSQKGRIRAIGNGIAVITAAATDGSGVTGTYTVYSHKYTAADTKWVAHRGLNTLATENTALAFQLAGEYGFWGAECDIWETKHERPEEEALASDPGADTSTTDAVTVSELSDSLKAKADKLISMIDDLPSSTNKLIDSGADVTKAKTYYDDLKSSVTAKELYMLRQRVTDKRLNKLFSAYADVEEYSSFDIVINHDNDFSRVFGLSFTDGSRKKVLGDTKRDSAGNDIDTYARFTKKDITDNVSGACFLSEYLSICQQYGMSPGIELKSSDMSTMSIKKTVDMVYQYMGASGLQEAHFISFYASPLTAVKKYANSKYGVTAYTCYLLSSVETFNTKLATAVKRSFTTMGIGRRIMTTDMMTACANNGLRIDAYGFDDVAKDDEYLYRILISGEYWFNGVNMINSATTDGKLFE